MIIAYRLKSANWRVGHRDHCFGKYTGKYTRVRPGSPTAAKMRPAHYPSECDWIIPGTVNHEELTCPTSTRASARSLTKPLTT